MLYFPRKYSNLIMIDRNILSLIRDCNRNINISKEKEYLIDLLKKYDSECNFISTIFSIIEGNKGRKENEVEKVITFIKDSNDLSPFVKYADYEAKLICDFNQFITYGRHLCGVRNWIEEYKESEFLKLVSPIISQPISKYKRFDVVRKICLYSKEYNIYLNTPLGFAIVMTIFGDQASRKILKPKEDKNKLDDKWSYNVLSDMYSIRLLFELEKSFKGTLFENIYFLTNDKSLREFLNRITFYINSNYQSIDKKIQYGPMPFSLDLRDLNLSEDDEMELVKCFNLLKYSDSVHL